MAGSYVYTKDLTVVKLWVLLTALIQRKYKSLTGYSVLNAGISAVQTGNQ